MNPSLYSCCFLLLVPGLVALPDIEIQQGRRLYTGYKVLRAHLTSDTDRAAVLQLEDGKLDLWLVSAEVSGSQVVSLEKGHLFILDSKAEQPRIRSTDVLISYYVERKI